MRCDQGQECSARASREHGIVEELFCGCNSAAYITCSTYVHIDECYVISLSLSLYSKPPPPLTQSHVLLRRRRHGYAPVVPADARFRSSPPPPRERRAPRGVACCDEVELRSEERAGRVGQSLCCVWWEGCESVNLVGD